MDLMRKIIHGWFSLRRGLRPAAALFVFILFIVPSAAQTSHSADALMRARGGYHQILKLVDNRAWPDSVRALVHRVFSEDLANVERALGSAASGASWRAAVRDGSRDP